MTKQEVLNINTQTIISYNLQLPIAPYNTKDNFRFATKCLI